MTKSKLAGTLLAPQRHAQLKSAADAAMAIFEYINGFYNPRRRHSALGWKSPLAFERRLLK